MRRRRRSINFGVKKDPLLLRQLRDHSRMLGGLSAASFLSPLSSCIVVKFATHNIDEVEHLIHMTHLYLFPTLPAEICISPAIMMSMSPHKKLRTDYLVASPVAAAKISLLASDMQSERDLRLSLTDKMARTMM